MQIIARRIAGRKEWQVNLSVHSDHVNHTELSEEREYAQPYVRDVCLPVVCRPSLGVLDIGQPAQQPEEAVQVCVPDMHPHPVIRIPTPALPACTRS